MVLPPEVCPQINSPDIPVPFTLPTPNKKIRHHSYQTVSNIRESCTDVTIATTFASIIAETNEIYPDPFRLSCGIVFDYDVPSTVWNKDSYVRNSDVQKFMSGGKALKIICPYNLEYNGMTFTVNDLYKVNNVFLQLKGFIPVIDIDSEGKRNVEVMGVWGAEGTYLHRLSTILKHSKESVVYSQ